MSLFKNIPPWGWVVGAVAFVVGVFGGEKASSAYDQAKTGPKPGKPSGSPPTLKPGSSGQWVLYLQGLLNVPATGSFDAPTTAATKAWQASHGLDQDSIVGPKTWGSFGVSMASSPAKPASPGNTQDSGQGYSGTVKVPIGAPGPSAPTTSLDWASIAASANEVSAGEFKAPPGGGESGRDWVMNLTQNMLQREAQCIAAVEQGFLYPVPWVEVSWNQDGHQVTIYVAADAVLVGKTDPIRITVSHLSAQIMADRLNACLPTSKMSNAAWLACSSKLGPSILNATWASVKPEHKAGAGAYLLDMATNQTVCEHSDRVSAQRKQAGLAGIASFASPNGKDWVSSERLLAPDGKPAAPSSSTIGHGGAGVAGANFGWQSPSGTAKVALGGVKVFQSIGLAHDWHHQDYCMAEGTLVDTPLGHRPIESLRAGDLVFSYNRRTERPDCSRVSAVKNTGIRPTLVVELDNGERIRCTPEHRWLLSNGQEIQAGSLVLGHSLLALRRSQAGAGYETLYSRSCHRYVYTHRAVACASAGIDLDTPGVTVHHLDENKRNNLPENLALLTRKGHADAHEQAAKTREQWLRVGMRERMSEAIRRSLRAREKTSNPKHVRRCDGCGVSFYRSASSLTNRQFCSQRCYLHTRWGQAGRNHVVVAVEFDGLSVPTWDIEVARDENFALAAGVFVHNSQVLTVYKKDCLVDGASRSVEEILLDPALAYLLSDEVLKGTPCKVTRHPAVAPGT